MGVAQPREEHLEEHTQRGGGAREGGDGSAAGGGTGAVQHGAWVKALP